MCTNKNISKIIINSPYIIKGLVFKITAPIVHLSCVSIRFGLRIFPRVEIIIENSSYLEIGKRTKIDTGALLAVSTNARLIMGDNVCIGRNNVVVSRCEIKIGDGTIFGPGVNIYDHDHVFDASNGVYPSEYKLSSISIGKHCWLGANVIVLRGCNIGDNCIIGAGSVVNKDVPSNCVACGNPIKIIKYL